MEGSFLSGKGTEHVNGKDTKAAGHSSNKQYTLIQLIPSRITLLYSTDAHTVERKLMKSPALRLLSQKTVSTGLLINTDAMGALRGALMLDCGIEIRAYSLHSAREALSDDLIVRSVSIDCAAIPYDPKVDLVAEDLRVTPAVLDAINRAWENPSSVEFITGSFQLI